MKNQARGFRMCGQQTIRIQGKKNLSLTVALLLSVYIALLCMDIGARASAPIRIGVLAYKGKVVCREMWQPTMDYLHKALPSHQFDLVPLKFDEVEPAVRNKSIDFLICNPAIYVDLEVKYGVTRTMTLRNLVGTQIVSEFGGVIFCRSDRSDILTLRDVRGQRLAATDQTSFGGWYMALREFRSAGIDPGRDCARLFFMDSHPAVVRSVLSGEADIGTVRTDTIERMTTSGEIRMDEIRVISADATPGLWSTFPYLHSTRLYPEWPFAKLFGTNEDLSREVTVALLNIPAISPAAIAAQSGGWGVSLDYTSVHDCLRELRMPPYEHYGQLSWQDMWRQHWLWLGAIAALIVALLASLLLLRGRNIAVMKVSGQNRLLLASAGEGICGIDVNGITTFVNPAATKILGYTSEELLGKRLHALTHHTKSDGRPYPNNECPIIMACKDGTVHKGNDELFYRKDGSAVPVSYSSRPIVDKGKIVGAVICFEDIAERKWAEDALRETESKYKELFELSPVGIFKTNSTGQAFFVNPEMARIVGADSSQEAVQNFKDLAKDLYVDPNRRKMFIDLLKDKGIVENFEYEAKALNGKRLWISMNARTREKLSDGTFIIDGFATNITERKRAEEALLESEKKYRLIAENTADLISTLDMNLNFTYISPGVMRLRGFTVEESMNQTLDQVLTPESLRLAFDVFENEILLEESGTADPDRTRILELAEYKKDGSIVWLEVSLTFLRNNDRKPVGILTVSREITERKLAEKERENLQSQLLQAQKMEAVGRLAGGVAHDFNNMLSAILGNAQLAMMKSNPAEPVYTNLKMIEDIAHRSASLTRQLLAFARKQIVAAKVLDINDTVAGMLKMLRRLIGEDLDLVWMPGAGLWQVKIDPSQIDQLLANLCVNARDAIAGVGKVTIETKNMSFDKEYCDAHTGIACGEYVMLTISDDGSGMSKEVLDHIFEPFFTTKEMGKGTGLGLASVYGIVKQNSGFINVYSEPDKGTTFKIYLPRFVGEAMESTVESDVEVLRGYGETVLLVEDEPLILEVNRAMLEQLGYDVLIAGTPGDALRLTKTNAAEIQLLITDVVMPEMNGRDLAKMIREIKPELGCLFMSGYTADVIAHNGVLDEGVNFIHKPFSINDLAVKVREVLEQNHTIG
jgi:PAS domain S-box-containing protein